MQHNTTSMHKLSLKQHCIYRIALNFWGSKFSRIAIFEDFVCVLQVARFVFTTCSPLTANFHTPATPPKPLSLHPLRPLKNCAHQSENVTYTPHVVCSYIKLQSKQTYGIRTTDIYIYMKSTVQLTSVGLAQAHPNNVHLLNQAAVVDNLEVEACECLHYQVIVYSPCISWSETCLLYRMVGVSAYL